MKDKGDIILAIIVLAILFYVLWYILAHSPQFATYSDLFIMWGGTLSIFILFVNKLFDRINKIDEKINSRINKIDEKIGILIKDVSYIKGRMNR